MATPYEINIKTTGDPSAAKQTDEALKNLNRTVEQSGQAAKKAEESTRSHSQQLSKLKQSVQGLALEFPLLARAITIATNPIAAALLAVSGGLASFAKGLQHIKDLGKDDSPLGPLVGDLNSIKALTDGVKKATDDYAESLKKVRDTPRVAMAKGRLGQLEAQPDRVTAAEKGVADAAARLEAARRAVAAIEEESGIKDLRTSKQVVRGNAALALGGGFERADAALTELEEAERAYGGSKNLLRSERQRFVNRGLQAGMIQADLSAAAQGQGPLAANPVYNGPVSVGPMQGPTRPLVKLVPVVQQAAESTEQAMQAIEARLRAQDAFNRAFIRAQQAQIRNLRNP